MTTIREALHLAKRFFGAVRPGAPDPDDEAWALDLLGDGEVDLWRRMNNPDRRHAVEVARKVESELGAEANRPIMAAALLHDVGKIVCGYRTPARVVATLVWAAVPDDEATDKALAWIDRGAPWRRLGLYRRHPELGEQLLINAGSDPLTSSWAADHHRPMVEWRLDRETGQVLKDCDDD